MALHSDQAGESDSSSRTAADNAPDKVVKAAGWTPCKLFCLDLVDNLLGHARFEQVSESVNAFATQSVNLLLVVGFNKGLDCIDGDVDRPGTHQCRQCPQKENSDAPQWQKPTA